ncbi:MAG: hypothetical protein GY755_12985 [Chloroflexi bacterium]|nr:hypothetical protein [Chloroflexota bacterium]
MKQRGIPLVMLAIGMILLAGSMGVAYSLWSETLIIDGLVVTGEVDGSWTSCICTDTPDGLDPKLTDYGLPWPYSYPSTYEAKNVGKTSCSIDQDDPRIMHLTIENGYPSYWGNCEVHFANTGTVPVHITGYAIQPENFTLSSANGADDGEIWVRHLAGPSTGAQLEPCPAPDGFWCENSFSMQFHVEQPAEENYTYSFDLVACLAQWNENPTLKECLAAAPQN